MGEFDDIIKDFLLESFENLDQLDEDFVALEDDPTDKEILDRIFRTIHTIKGTCGFLSFSRLEKVTHTGENLLGKLRDGEIILNEDITSALLTMVDAVREILSRIEQTNEEGEEEYQELIAALTALLDNNAAPPAATESKVAETTSEPEPETSEPEEENEEPATPEVVAEPEEKPAAKKKTPPAPAKKPAAKQNTESSEKTPRTSGLSDSTIRVDVKLLDNLMNLVGELVLVRNQTNQITTEREDKELLSASQRLDFITTELQEGFMKTRMQPINQVWSKFPRVVRDISHGCGKQVRLEMEGKETELDKSLLEAIKDPLTHAVRNAIDHGVEDPETRKAAGKDPEGVLMLRAYHEGGLVNIEIADDGGGIDTDAVALKALDNGIIDSEKLRRMTEREMLNLIFLPGFSTAKSVTNISGRGVGMDVVRSNIEKIGGTVDLSSTLGKGTCLTVKIPLTLAIIPALVVASSKQRYCIPQVSLVEIVRLKGSEETNRIENVYGAPVYRLRGELLPILYLNEFLEMQDKTASNETTTEPEQKRINIVVLRASNRQFGLVVDEIQDTQEIVVKPLSQQLQHISCYAGATIMGDGQVALILDVLGLAQRTDIVSEAGERSAFIGQRLATSEHEETDTMLLFKAPDDGRMAISLSHVARLEEIPTASIENVGGRQMVQYRGGILPLVTALSLIPERRSQPRVENTQKTDVEPEDEEVLSVNNNMTQIVVYEHEGKSVGLIVGPLIDILEVPLRTKGPSTREGILYTLVIAERLTELLDVEAIVQKAAPQIFDDAMVTTEEMA